MKKIKRQIGYDIKTGMSHVWKKYVVYVLVLALFTCSMYHNSRFIIAEKGFSWLDCISGYFRGMYDFSLVERTQAFRIPIEWFVFHMGYVLLGISYPYHDYAERGYQFLIRAGSKKLWWMSKYLWSIGNAVLYCLIFYGITRLFTVVIDESTLWNGSDIWGFGLGDFANIYVAGVLFLMPVMTAAAIAALELCLSFIWNQTGAFITVLMVLVASAYWKHPMLIGNYTMLYRYSLQQEKLGQQLLVGVGLCLIIMIVSGVAGYKAFERQEFIKKGDFHVLRG